MLIIIFPLLIMKNLTKLYFFCFLSILFFALNSCGIYKKTNTRDVPTNASERARAAVKEGKGIGIGNIFKKGNNFEFSSSNPMWRASLEILDFLPLAVVDYSGGILITDWYADDFDSENSIKITLRFLSNEIRADSLKIIVHEKKCSSNSNCKVKVMNSRIQQELLTSILRTAAIIDKKTKKK